MNTFYNLGAWILYYVHKERQARAKFASDSHRIGIYIVYIDIIYVPFTCRSGLTGLVGCRIDIEANILSRKDVVSKLVLVWFPPLDLPI